MKSKPVKTKSKCDCGKHNVEVQWGQMMTVGRLKKELKLLKAKDDALIRTRCGKNWMWTMNASYCKPKNKVSLW